MGKLKEQWVSSDEILKVCVDKRSREFPYREINQAFWEFHRLEPTMCMNFPPEILTTESSEYMEQK